MDLHSMQKRWTKRLDLKQTKALRRATMVQIITETEYKHTRIHFTHQDIEISVQQLKLDAVAINFAKLDSDGRFDSDMSIYLTIDQAKQLSELLRG